MELVYLWVEDYKNIQRQGFNFSPRFECKFYDEYEKDENGKEKLKADCKLEITPKEHIENFFGDNINVTAIVGKNGSGKSRVLEILEQIFTNKIVETDYCILVYKNGSNTKVVSNIDSLECEFNVLNQASLHSKYRILTFDKNHNFIRKNNNSSRCISLEKVDIIDKLWKHNEDGNFELSTFMYIPSIIEVKTKDINSLFNEIVTFTSDMYSYDNSISNKENHKMRRALEDTLGTLKDEITQDYHKFLLVLFDNSCGFDDITDSFTNIEDLKTRLDDCGQSYPSSDDFCNFFIDIENAINNLDDEHKEFIKEYIDFFEIDFIDDKDRRYNHLSTGERNIFGEFINIFHYIKNGSRHNKIFLLDEPDNTLHPNWQKQYINELIIMLEKLNSSYDKLHFILTTHSPFLLSDIPKQNIIFLDTDEKGNCKVVDGLKEKKQTFGANIHTLLSDSFFMDGGLMGEFAKVKIDKAIKLLNQEQLNEDDLKYCEQIISIIGEPIVKNQLQRMLDSKRLKKVDEIDAIKQSMLEMQQRLDELEK